MEIKKATDSVKVDLPVQERKLACLKENVMDTVGEVFSHPWTAGQKGGMKGHKVDAHFENSVTKKVSKRGLELGIHKTKIETSRESQKHKKH